MSTLLLVVFWLLTSQEQGTASPRLNTVARHATSAWQDQCRQLLARPDNHGLLLRCLTEREALEWNHAKPGGMQEKFDARPPQLPVLRFTPGADSLEIAPGNAWLSAGAPISGTQYQGLAPYRWDPKADKLEYEGEPVEAEGRWVVMVMTAPNGTQLSILSADGTRDASPGLFFGPTKRYAGPFFHELRSMTNGERVGYVSRLAEAANLVPPEAIWTSDSDYTIYRTVRFDYLWIVDNTQHAKER